MYKAIIGFVIGAVVGSAASYLYLKKSSEEQLSSEIESVKAYYSGDKNKQKQDEKQNISDSSQTPTVFNGHVVKEYRNYTSLYDGSKSNKNSVGEKLVEEQKTLSEVIEEVERPYVITQQEFSENFDYNTFTLTYFKDGVLVDDVDEPIDEPEKIVGSDFASYFTDSDVVYVRSDLRQSDYEIVMDTRTYEEFIAQNPYMKRD